VPKPGQAGLRGMGPAGKVYPDAGP
jgi:hypothetical protein